jgi:hypothetical protein
MVRLTTTSRAEFTISPELVSSHIPAVVVNFWIVTASTNKFTPILLTYMNLLFALDEPSITLREAFV